MTVDELNGLGYAGNSIQSCAADAVRLTELIFCGVKRRTVDVVAGASNEVNPRKMCPTLRRMCENDFCGARNCCSSIIAMDSWFCRYTFRYIELPAMTAANSFSPNAVTCDITGTSDDVESTNTIEKFLDKTNVCSMCDPE